MLKIRKTKRLFNHKYENSSLYFLYKYHYHFFHSLIYEGKKLWAFKFFVNVKYHLKKSEFVDPLLVFFIAITNITPEVLLFPLKQGGIVNEVAMPITIRKQIIFATKWIIKLLRDKYSLLSIVDVVDTLIDAVKDDGVAVEKKKKVHFEAIRNRFLIKYFK